MAIMSSTNGVEIRPSGLTGTVIDSSGLRQTNIFNESPGPIRYSALARADSGGAGGSVFSGPQPDKPHARRTSPIPRPVHRTPGSPWFQQHFPRPPRIIDASPRRFPLLTLLSLSYKINNKENLLRGLLALCRIPVSIHGISRVESTRLIRRGCSSHVLGNLPQYPISG